MDVEVTNVSARRLYQRLGYTVVARHDHHWIARHSTTDTIIATGTSDTWLMRAMLTSPAQDTPSNSGEGRAMNS